MRGRAAFVYHGSSVDKIGRTVGVLTARYFRVAVMNHILVDNRKLLIHNVHWTPPLILIVLSRLGRGIQSATEMLLFKKGGVLRIVLTAFVDMRYADAVVFFRSMCIS